MNHPNQLVIELIQLIPKTPSAIDTLGAVIQALEGKDSFFDCNIQKLGHEIRVGFSLVEENSARDLLACTRAYIRFTIDERTSTISDVYMTNRIFAKNGMFLSGNEVYKFPDFIVENNADRSIELGDIYKELFLETLQGAML